MTDTTDALIAARAASHGDFAVASEFTQAFKYLMRQSPNWGRLSAVHREGLEMIAFKLARALCGDPRHRDHYDDIAGYARLVAERLPCGREGEG